MNSDASDIVRQGDVLDVARANALNATLGRETRLQEGDPLPPFFHQAYFWDPQVPSALGRDGHPKVGGLIPDFGLPRRMWAGARLTFEAPLRAGLPAERVTRVDSVVSKQGRSGQLGFVTLRHDIWQGGQICVQEWQDLVYRADHDPMATSPEPPQARPDADVAQPMSFTTTQLFRYSALTFNGHRIHYDLDYARDVEGYSHLVVHGPLLAQMLVLMAESALGSLAVFEFRGTAALTLDRSARMCRNGSDLWVQGEDGVLYMTARASAQAAN